MTATAMRQAFIKSLEGVPAEGELYDRVVTSLEKGAGAGRAKWKVNRRGGKRRGRSRRKGPVS